MKTDRNSEVEKKILIEKNLLAINSISCKQFLLDSIHHCDKLLIDMDLVSDCDTAGVQLLLSLKKSANSMNKQVRLKNVPHIVSDAVGKYGLKLSDLFAIESEGEL